MDSDVVAVGAQHACFAFAPSNNGYRFSICRRERIFVPLEKRMAGYCDAFRRKLGACRECGGVLGHRLLCRLVAGDFFFHLCLLWMETAAARRPVDLSWCFGIGIADQRIAVAESRVWKNSVDDFSEPFPANLSS